MSRREDGPARQTQSYTLSALRAFHEAEAWQLEQDAKRRGAWKGEPERREAFEATVRLIDRISKDSVIVERLKAR